MILLINDGEKSLWATLTEWSIFGSKSEAQANDWAYRIGQKKDVSIYYPIGKHPRLESFDIKLDKLLNRKTFTKDALVTYPKMTEKELAENARVRFYRDS